MSSPSAPRKRHHTPPTATATVPPPPPSNQQEWLTHVIANSQNRMTPLGAFFAALPKVPQRQPKTSAQRGRAFRERQHIREKELEKMVQKLETEIARLERSRGLYDMQRLQTRTSPTGSLVQMIHEYHHLFRDGLLEIPNLERQLAVPPVDHNTSVIQRIQQQEQFVRCVFDESAVVGNLVGPEASLLQWRLYTKAHGSATSEVVTIQVTSFDDHFGHSVQVAAHSKFHSILTRETFKMMFPHMLSDEAFIQRIIGRKATYSIVKYFQFTQDGRISMETADLDFVDSFCRAGCTLAEIERMLSGAAISKANMIVEVDAEAPKHTVNPPPLRHNQRKGR